MRYLFWPLDPVVRNITSNLITNLFDKNKLVDAKDNANLGGVFNYFVFSSLPGEMIQFDEHIFQMGWFNHQLVTHWS